MSRWAYWKHLQPCLVLFDRFKEAVKLGGSSHTNVLPVSDVVYVPCPFIEVKNCRGWCGHPTPPSNFSQVEAVPSLDDAAQVQKHLVFGRTTA